MNRPALYKFFLVGMGLGISYVVGDNLRRYYKRELTRIRKSNEAWMGFNDDIREIERVLTTAPRGTPEYDAIITKIRDMALLYPDAYKGIIALLGED